MNITCYVPFPGFLCKTHLEPTDECIIQELRYHQQDASAKRKEHDAFIGKLKPFLLAVESLCDELHDNLAHYERCDQGSRCACGFKLIREAYAKVEDLLQKLNVSR